jgi:hypothetical protein
LPTRVPRFHFTLLTFSKKRVRKLRILVLARPMYPFGREVGGNIVNLLLVRIHRRPAAIEIFEILQLCFLISNYCVVDAYLGSEVCVWFLSIMTMISKKPILIQQTVFLSNWEGSNDMIAYQHDPMFLFLTCSMYFGKRRMDRVLNFSGTYKGCPCKMHFGISNRFYLNFNLKH